MMNCRVVTVTLPSLQGLHARLHTCRPPMTVGLAITSHTSLVSCTSRVTSHGGTAVMPLNKEQAD